MPPFRNWLDFLDSLWKGNSQKSVCSISHNPLQVDEKRDCETPEGQGPITACGQRA